MIFLYTQTIQQVLNSINKKTDDTIVHMQNTEL